MRAWLPLLVLSALGVGSLALVEGCAHEPSGPPPLTTLDYLDDTGTVRSLAGELGKIVVVDVCLASVDPCLLNAKALSEACDAMCGEEVVMFSLLLDETAPEAVGSYRRVLEVQHRVQEAGPQVRSGASALGSVGAVPRIVIFDRKGVLVEDVVGLLITNKKLSERVAELLDD